MSKEIEYKFTVIDDSYKSLAVAKHHIVQGYLCRRPESTVRVRIKDDAAYITIKGKNIGAERDEWEYSVPMTDAREMLQRCCEGIVIEKIRHIVPVGNHVWEVDEFISPANASTVAEVEVASVDEMVEIPSFVGENVTGDPRYYNSNLGSSVC